MKIIVEVHGANGLVVMISVSHAGRESFRDFGENWRVGFDSRFAHSFSFFFFFTEISSQIAPTTYIKQTVAEKKGRDVETGRDEQEIEQRVVLDYVKSDDRLLIIPTHVHSCQTLHTYPSFFLLLLQAVFLLISS